ncbi:hypothetical protein SAMN05216516_103264 [Izhakiella capsodis]|uniref:Uncharacterized protein n=1 Tax=Izhakiella capsodis TaxID=1367852 RepID=A0A1I4X2G3_9GAMM|nr:hypothetical protein SAMN05216516_103264 [Izhakiella capsodis]
MKITNTVRLKALTIFVLLHYAVISLFVVFIMLSDHLADKEFLNACTIQQISFLVCHLRRI